MHHCFRTHQNRNQLSSCKPPALMKTSYQNSMPSSILELCPYPTSRASAGDNGNWSCDSSLTVWKADGMLELSEDSASDQKLSWISGNDSSESICSSLMPVFMCISMFLIGESVIEENSLEDDCGDIFPGKFKLTGSDWHAEPESHLDAAAVEWPLELGVANFFLSLFFKLVCHTFFISLSVRPGNLAAMADHLKNETKRIPIRYLYKFHEYFLFERTS